MREVRNACTISVVKRKGKTPLGRLVTDGQNNTILDLKWAACVRACVRACMRVWTGYLLLEHVWWLLVITVRT
jgi:hypothetical protein